MEHTKREPEHREQTADHHAEELALDPEEDEGENEEDRPYKHEHATAMLLERSRGRRLLRDVRMAERLWDESEDGTYAMAEKPLAPPQPISTMEKEKTHITKLMVVRNMHPGIDCCSVPKKSKRCGICETLPVVGVLRCLRGEVQLFATLSKTLFELDVMNRLHWYFETDSRACLVLYSDT